MDTIPPIPDIPPLTLIVNDVGLMILAIGYVPSIWPVPEMYTTVVEVNAGDGVEDKFTVATPMETVNVEIE